MIRAVIIGASGRMGQAMLRTSREVAGLTVVAAIVSATSAALNRDAGEVAGIGKLGLRTSADVGAALAQADVAIDFSTALSTQAHLRACVTAGKPLLIGTTGFRAELEAEFDKAARDIPLLVAPNTSLGVTLLIELVRQAARALPGSDFDIEIIEAHHRMKRDAPSGTALALGRAAAEGRQERLQAAQQAPSGGGALLQAEAPPVGLDASHPRAGRGASTAGPDIGPPHIAQPRSGQIRGDGLRLSGEIGFAAIRGGDIVGEHEVLFAGTGESLTLAHRATDRAIFARGALRAAAWLAVRAPGRYFMRDLVTYKSGS